MFEIGRRVGGVHCVCCTRTKSYHRDAHRLLMLQSFESLENENENKKSGAREQFERSYSVWWVDEGEVVCYWGIVIELGGMHLVTTASVGQ